MFPGIEGVAEVVYTVVGPVGPARFVTHKVISASSRRILKCPSRGTRLSVTMVVAHAIYVIVLRPCAERGFLRVPCERLMYCFP